MFHFNLSICVHISVILEFLSLILLLLVIDYSFNQQVFVDCYCFIFLVTTLFFFSNVHLDLGHGERDGTIQIEKLEQASLNTTKHVSNEINKTNLVIHIGDLSYAVGFSAEVSL